MPRVEFTKATMRAAWRRCEGKCESCGTPFYGKPKIYDHINPTVFSHNAELSNCQVLCVECNRKKTGEEDIPAIAKSNRVLDREAGLTRLGSIRTWRSR
jgi:5-methylcytosine-specific restriction protein A